MTPEFDPLRADWQRGLKRDFLFVIEGTKHSETMEYVGLFQGQGKGDFAKQGLTKPFRQRSVFLAQSFSSDQSCRQATTRAYPSMGLQLLGHMSSPNVLEDSEKGSSDMGY